MKKKIKNDRHSFDIMMIFTNILYLILVFIFYEQIVSFMIFIINLIGVETDIGILYSSIKIAIIIISSITTIYILLLIYHIINKNENAITINKRGMIE